MELLDLYTQYNLPGGIILDLPNVGGWFSGGIFSAIGQGMFIFLAIMLVVWIGFAIYGAFSIISSFGDPQKIEKGWKTIKSVWIGITYFLLFFAVVGLIAAFLGVGAPWRWAENLQQCAQGGPAAGRFYFQGIVENGERIPVSEQLSKFASANTGADRAYVVCCESDTRKYITLQSNPATIGICEVNSVINIRGTSSSACIPLNSACVENGQYKGSCCSGTCTQISPGTSVCRSPNCLNKGDFCVQNFQNVGNCCFGLTCTSLYPGASTCN